MDYGIKTAIRLPADDPYADHALNVLGGYRTMVAPDGSRWIVSSWEVAALRRHGWKRAVR